MLLYESDDWAGIQKQSFLERGLVGFAAAAKQRGRKKMNMMTVKDEGERRLATYIIFTTFRANPRLRLQNARMKVEVPKHRGVAFKRILIGEKVPIPHIFDARVGECLPLCFFSGLHAFQ